MKIQFDQLFKVIVNCKMSTVPFGKVGSIQWSFLSADQWRGLAVAEITRPCSKDAGNSTEDKANTPYDSRLGEQANYIPCATCGKTSQECPGHFGIIELPFKVYNRICVSVVLKTLQVVCDKCSRPRLPLEKIKIHSKLKAFKRLKAIFLKSKTAKNCPWEDCGEPLAHFTKGKNKDPGVIYINRNGKPEIFSAEEAYDILSKISLEHLSQIGFNNYLSENEKYKDPKYFIDEDDIHVHQFRPESMIFSVLPVLPLISRPWITNEQEDNERKDDDLTDKYNLILKSIIKWKTLNGDIPTVHGRKSGIRKNVKKTKEVIEKEICEHIWQLIDNSKTEKKSNGGRVHRSLVCRLSSKGGHIQTNITGKRSDFTARTVIIGGGVRLKKDELGIPYDIAKILTKPEFVRAWNIHAMQKLVQEGKVNRLIRKGSKRNLCEFPDHGTHFILKEGDIIERQLQDGDIVLFNRQPTLRIESMVSFRAKIVEGLAFQLGLCWTASFNADFDGDEMNLHVPQNIEAETEIMINSRCAYHIMSAQRNSPVNSVVQDALVAVYILTMKWENEEETMISRNLAMQIYTELFIDEKRFQDFITRARDQYPEYVKKNKLKKEIPGKLFLSIIFPGYLNYNSNGVVIKRGIILPSSNRLCKKTIGSKKNSVIHFLWKESPEIALAFVSELQQLTDRWLPNHGFSMGLSDCLTEKSIDIARVILETRTSVANLEIAKEDNEAEINCILNNAMGKCHTLAKDAMKKGEKNALNVMRNSGAKGSVINLAQITAFVGQQNVKGNRMAMTLNNGKRCLTSYLIGDKNPDARGFVESNYINGLSPQEFFFHAAAGRDGIISTSLKTAHTGYIQKKITRKLENLKTHIDLTVRDSKDNIVSFLYGDDGMDAKKLIYNDSQPFFINIDYLVNKLNIGEEEKRKINETEINFLMSQISLHEIKTPVIDIANQNIREKLKILIEKIEICPKKIPEFFALIKTEFNCCKISYGTMVGLIAASSIGEPTTQMVLNVFHFAGVREKDVNSGVPYFEKIINTTRIKKDVENSSRIYFKGLVKENSIKIRQKAENAKELNKSSIKFVNMIKSFAEESFLGDFLDDHELRYIPGHVGDSGFSPTGLLTYKKYKKAWWVDLYEKMEIKDLIEPQSWVIFLKFDVQKLFNKRIKLQTIASVIEENINGGMSCIPSSTSMGLIEIRVNFPHLITHTKTKIEELSYVNDENLEYFLARDVAIDFLKKIRVKGIKNISKCSPYEDKKEKEWVINTQGLNYYETLKLENIDSTRSQPLSIHEVKEYFGIEAARRFMFDEIYRIITFDGTYVNPRHISILVDSMTHHGKLTAASRDGIVRDDVGPNAKILFEKPIENAMVASTFGEVDDMKSLASSVMYGKEMSTGQGAVSVIQVEE